MFNNFIIDRNIENYKFGVMEFSKIVYCFVIYWGEMGFVWGVNCIVVQIYVLFYFYGKLLYVEEIFEMFLVVCFNVSNSLKELQNWNLICVIYQLGDWCDYFEILLDVWELFCIIVCEWCECEFEFIVRLLNELMQDESFVCEVFDVQDCVCEILVFMGMLGVWFEEMLCLLFSMLQKVLKMGVSVQKFVCGDGGV